MNFDFMNNNWNLGLNSNIQNGNNNSNNKTNTEQSNQQTKNSMKQNKKTLKIYRKLKAHRTGHRFGYGYKKKRDKNRTFKVRRQKLPPAIVYGHVYSDQCGYCISMQNEWNILRTKTKIPLYDIGKDYESRIQHFNTKYDTDLKYSGFPTIFRLKKYHDKVEYYSGERTSNSMLEWLNSR